MKSVIATLSLALLIAPFAYAGESDLLYEQALQRYEVGDYREAYAALTGAAEAGHVRAQEMAGLMSLAGPSLYGQAVQREEETAMRWLRRAAQGGSDVGRHFACAQRVRQASDTFCGTR